MLYLNPPAASRSRSQFRKRKLIIVTGLLLLAAISCFITPAGLPNASLAAGQTTANTYRKEVETAKVSLSVKSRNGRVGVIASEAQTKNVIMKQVQPARRLLRPMSKSPARGHGRD